MGLDGLPSLTVAAVAVGGDGLVGPDGLETCPVGRLSLVVVVGELWEVIWVVSSKSRQQTEPNAFWESIHSESPPW